MACRNEGLLARDQECSVLALLLVLLLLLGHHRKLRLGIQVGLKTKNRLSGRQKVSNRRSTHAGQELDESEPRHPELHPKRT